jgi:hypothetical protein
MTKLSSPERALIEEEADGEEVPIPIRPVLVRVRKEREVVAKVDGEEVEM